MFFSLDGVDGTGKSTQVRLFAQWLETKGHDVVACRDPGSTELGESLRRIVLEHHTMPVHCRSEMLIYMAARAQLVEQVIRPAIQAGRTVVSDRFLLANVVYQGHAGGLSAEQIWEVGRVATGAVMPDLTFVLDMDVSQASSRRNDLPDRMESRGSDYLQRVRDGYLTEAARHPESMIVIDASADMDTVRHAIELAARRVLEKTERP